jgi:hypothetical protein
MNSAHRAVILGALLMACSVVGLAGQQAAAPAPPRLTPEETETFLLNAPLVGRLRSAGKGVTNSKRGTLSDGRVTHDVHVQGIDDKRSIFEAGAKTELNFKDWWGFNIAGYRVARLVGLDTVPVSVERRIQGNRSAVTWWVDDFLMDEEDRKKKGIDGPNPRRTADQMQLMLVFDELIQNKDRNAGNIIWTTSWTMWLIDHTRAFRTGKDLLRQNELRRCERRLFDGMRRLTAESLSAAVGNWMTKDEKEALLARRDLLVKHFQARIAELGEDAVLFTR